MTQQQGMPTADAVDRGCRRIAQLVTRSLPLADFFAEADRILRTLVAYDAPCWMSCDPSTLLPTAHHAAGSDAVHLLDVARDEFLEDDVNRFTDLARARLPAASLRQATGGQPRRSARFVRTVEPLGHGDGDELRAVFAVDGVVWGYVILHRISGAFTLDEVELVASLGPLFAEGIRRSILVSSPLDDDAAPGLIVLSPGDRVEAITPPARRWIAEMIDSGGRADDLPLAVLGLAARARHVAAGMSPVPATARLPLRGGGWVLAHAVMLEDAGAEGRIGVTLSPAGRSELSAIVVEAYGLSPREREITRLVMTGLDTEQLARRLSISPYTVQDHLKSVFRKIGVHSRRELVAEVFFRHAISPPVDGRGATISL